MFKLNCRIIWGDGVDDLDDDTDDYENYMGRVRKDYGLEIGLPIDYD